jgi:hypothetical protein
MKKTLLTLCLTFLASGAFSQIIFSEDFNNSVGMPAGWTLINNDGLTPATNVAYVNNAWINRVDFILPSTTDSCAFSTSWYTPAGTSDDWMITPPIAVSAGATSVDLDWDAMAPDAAYLDGYQVWVSTGPPTVAGMTGGTMVFSTPAADNVWTMKNADLTAFAGSNIYVGFRNNSTDKFLLMIDSIYVTENAAASADVSMTADASEYTIVPLAQITPLGASGVINNVGTSDVTNAVMTVNVYDGAMANVYNASSTPTNILSGANAATSVAGYTPLVADLYTVEQIVSITEADVNNLNDTSYYQLFVSDSTYARDNGIITGSLGIGPNTPGTLGQQFAINAAADVTTISFWINNNAGTMTNQPVVMSVYDMVAGEPNAIVAQTTSLTILNAVDSLYTMPIATGPYNLVPGDYMFAVEEGDSNTVIGTTIALFTPLTTWVTFPTAPILPWANNEDYGFNVSYVIRPNFASCAATTASVTAGSCANYTAPSGAVYTATGVYTDVIPNACGADSVITINLTIGTTSTASVTASVCSSYTAPSGAVYTTTGLYADTIPNSCGGDSIISINLTVGANTTASVTVTECTLYTAPSGATYTATGVYTDVIPNACGGDSTITINLTVPVLNLSVTLAGATLTSGAGGTSTYQWIDCGTMTPVAGATSQAYTATVDGNYAVIVTTSGCTDTSACTAVLVGGLNDIAANGGLKIYPNPSNGDFTVNVIGITANAVNIEVIDFSGRVVGTRTFNNVQGQLAAEMNMNVEAGSYLVRISANGESTVQTIVISK